MSTRVPEISSVEKAIEIYYTCTAIGNKEIKELFQNVKSDPTARKLKKMVKDKMEADNIESFNSQKVNPIVAFKVWGLDIKRLEKMYSKMAEYDL